MALTNNPSPATGSPRVYAYPGAFFCYGPCGRRPIGVFMLRISWLLVFLAACEVKVEDLGEP